MKRGWGEDEEAAVFHTVISSRGRKRVAAESSSAAVSVYWALLYFNINIVFKGCEVKSRKRWRV